MNSPINEICIPCDLIRNVIFVSINLGSMIFSQLEPIMYINRQSTFSEKESRCFIKQGGGGEVK